MYPATDRCLVLILVSQCHGDEVAMVKSDVVAAIRQGQVQCVPSKDFKYHTGLHRSRRLHHGKNDDIRRESANIMHLPELRLSANQLMLVLDE
ncbi:hypothetical protein J1614_011649 [Plenodomus biglobosus]|nr:hypothetical protein J1614_011649 [Plenodomus biglobosus]